MKVVLFWLSIACIYMTSTVHARTRADDIREMSRGGANVVLGALQGQVYLIRRGVTEGGEINTIFDENLGALWKLGKPWVHYPKWPALHLAVASGKHDHLNAAFYFMTHGANITEYQLPIRAIHETHGVVDIGYGPAMLYALGLGGIKVDAQHAALLQRLKDTLGEHFDLAPVNNFLRDTGNPPLIHIPAYVFFVEGIHVLLEDFQLDINTRDQYGGTVLHVAAWLGQLELAMRLLSKGANRLIADSSGRTPLHYAIIRGHAAMVGLLSVAPKGMSAAQEKALKHELFETPDKHGRNAHALARLHPILPGMIDLLEQETGAASPAARQLVRHSRRRVYEREEADDVGMRGGWAFPAELQLQDSSNSEIIAEIHANSNINVVIGDSLSKGVFKRDYFSVQKPVLLTGEPFGNLPIWSYWRREDFLLRYGAIKVAVLHPQDTLQSSRAENSAGTIADFLSEMERAAHSTPDGTCPQGGRGASTFNKVAFTKVASVQQPLLWEDIIPPPLFQLCNSPGAGVSAARSAAHRQRQYPLRLVVNPRGASFPMHSRAASWDLLITGQKQWYLLPPMPLPNFGTKSEIDLEMADSHAEVRARAKNLDRLRSTPDLFLLEAAKMRSEGLLFEVTQLPGEVLFVPHDWEQLSVSHAAADSLSISQEMCSWTHSDVRFTPLSLAVYGGKDDHRDQAGHPPTGYSDFFGMMSMIKGGGRDEMPEFTANVKI